MREKPGLKKITSHYPITRVVLLLQKRVYNVKVPFALPLKVSWRKNYAQFLPGKNAQRTCNFNKLSAARFFLIPQITPS